MAHIPNNYPAGASDAGITQAISELSQEVMSSGANINTVMQLTPLISVGQNELLKRNTERMTQAIVKVEAAISSVERESAKVHAATKELKVAVDGVHTENVKNTAATKELTQVVDDLRTITTNAVGTSERAGRISQFLAVISLIVAALSVGLTVYFANSANRSSSLLLDSQLKQMEQENANHKSINSTSQH